MFRWYACRSFNADGWREIRGGKNIVLVYGMTETFGFLSFTNVEAGKESPLVSSYQPISFVTQRLLMVFLEFLQRATVTYTC